MVVRFSQRSMDRAVKRAQNTLATKTTAADRMVDDDAEHIRNPLGVLPSEKQRTGAPSAAGEPGAARGPTRA